MDKYILDACCGPKMFWFDKNHKNAIYVDKRQLENYKCCDGRTINVKPDIICDFIKLPFKDNKFNLVVFDPPHAKSGENSWLNKKYGRLENGWENMLKLGFDECWRALCEKGVLIFKWNETSVSVNKIIKLLNIKPLFGHKSGKSSKTHWLCFMKII